MNNQTALIQEIVRDLERAFINAQKLHSSGDKRGQTVKSMIVNAVTPFNFNQGNTMRGYITKVGEIEVSQISATFSAPGQDLTINSSGEQFSTVVPPNPFEVPQKKTEIVEAVTKEDTMPDIIEQGQEFSQKQRAVSAMSKGAVKQEPDSDLIAFFIDSTPQQIVNKLKNRATIDGVVKKLSENGLEIPDNYDTLSNRVRAGLIKQFVTEQAEAGK